MTVSELKLKSIVNRNPIRFGQCNCICQMTKNIPLHKQNIYQHNTPHTWWETTGVPSRREPMPLPSHATLHYSLLMMSFFDQCLLILQTHLICAEIYPSQYFTYMLGTNIRATPLPRLHLIRMTTYTPPSHRTLASNPNITPKKSDKEFIMWTVLLTVRGLGYVGPKDS